MAKSKGGEGKGATKTVAEREKASKAVKDHDKALKNQKDKARKALGPEWYVSQNAGKSSDKESFIAGMAQPYAFPGGDQPSVHLELSSRANTDGTKRELVIVYHSAHDGHTLVGLNKGTFLKARWLSNGGFKSTAINPSIKKTQDAVIGYLLDFFAGPITMQNTVVEIAEDERPKKQADSNTPATPEQSVATVTTEFTLENESENDRAKTGQITFPVKTGKVVISMSRSQKYTGKDWGYAPMNAYLHQDNGSNRCLWDLYQQDKELGLFYNLIQTADDDFIVIGTKGKGKEKVLFTAVSLRSEAEKVEVVSNGVLTLLGGMNLISMIGFKSKLARLTSTTLRLTEEEMNMKRRLDGAKTRMANEEKKQKDFLKAKEAGERQRKLMDDIIANHTVTVYDKRGEAHEMYEVGSDAVALYFQPGTHVIMRDKDGAPIHKMVRSRDTQKFLAKAEDVTFERPTFEGKAKVLDTKVSYINPEYDFQEVVVVPDRQSVVTLRAQGLNSGAFVAYRDEEDGQMVITRVFAEKIEEIARQKELESV